MQVIQILKQDYQHFPLNQTYNIYAENVYFQDPLNQFKGVVKYQKMIKFLSNFFQNIRMELHDITQNQDLINSKWTLHLTVPLPWQPCLTISGRSELKLNQDNLIISHIDYWNCSPFAVLLQVFNWNQE